MVFINSISYIAPINGMTDELILLSITGQTFHIPVVDYIKNTHYTKRIYIVKLSVKDDNLICLFDTFFEEYIATPHDIFILKYNKTYIENIIAKHGEATYIKIPEDYNDIENYSNNLPSGNEIKD